jgi:ABC-2 type transport system ATP-binding protein
VRRLIQELSKERTVLLSSHILPEIEATCPRVIILHRGRIAADGTQAELVSALGESSVRLEVAAGANADAAAALRRVPGLRSVEARGRAGEFEAFELRGDGELCTEVGRLCQANGWVVRELAVQRATLERLFARIAFELEPERARVAEGAA